MTITGLINRIVGEYHDINDFVLVYNKSLNPNFLDTFEVIINYEIK